jgi:hypothetical protein
MGFFAMFKAAVEDLARSDDPWKWSADFWRAMFPKKPKDEKVEVKKDD